MNFLQNVLKLARRNEHSHHNNPHITFHCRLYFIFGPHAGAGAGAEVYGATRPLSQAHTHIHTTHTMSILQTSNFED